jgi:hypothetical protein
MTLLVRLLASGNARCSAPPGLLSCSSSKSPPLAREDFLLPAETKGARLGSFRPCLCTTDVTARVTPTRVSAFGPFRAAHAIAFCLRSIVFCLSSTFPTLPDVLYLCSILDLTTYSKIDIYNNMVVLLYDQNLRSHQLRPKFEMPMQVDARVRACPNRHLAKCARG